MRITSAIFFLWLGVGSTRLHAEVLYSAPGWSLTKIEQGGGEENTYGDARVFYALKPPDPRPAMTIDSRTATRLRSGEVTAEAAYGGQAQKTAEKKSDDEFVWGKHSVEQAAPVNSTLTLDDGRKDDAFVAEQAKSAAKAETSTFGSSSKFGTSSSFGGGVSSSFSSGSPVRAPSSMPTTGIPPQYNPPRGNQ